MPDETKPQEIPAEAAVEAAPVEVADAEPTEAAAEAEPMAIELPAPQHRSSLNWNLTSITAISFSLTFVLVSIALLTGLLPPTLATMPMPVDLGVMLLLVPLCALVLAMMAEVLRAAMTSIPAGREPRVEALTGWRPGHGEG